MRTIKYNNKFFGYLACKPSSFTFPLCGSQVPLIHHNQRDKMATSFVVQKGVVKMLPQVLKFLFHAPKWKVLINCLHIWNEVLSRVDNHLKAIKLRSFFAALKSLWSLSEGTKEIYSKHRWLAIFNKYFLHPLVINEYV